LTSYDGYNTVHQLLVSSSATFPFPVPSNKKPVVRLCKNDAALLPVKLLAMQPIQSWLSFQAAIFL
jgi:hypothetical protein